MVLFSLAKLYIDVFSRDLIFSQSYNKAEVFNILQAGHQLMESLTLTFSQFFLFAYGKVQQLWMLYPLSILLQCLHCY